MQLGSGEFGVEKPGTPKIVELRTGGRGTEGGWLVGWLVVLPGRGFPFLSGAGPSPLYRGGEPVHLLEVILLVVLLVFHQGGRPARN